MVDFSSAYTFDSLQDFEYKVIQSRKPIFFYPALIPSWIPHELIAREVNLLTFKEHIELRAKRFLTEEMKRPYHGLHLRRTDLNIGLTDLEVHRTVSSHRNELFFVCSDDPEAESLAAAHPNVRSRKKQSYVSKNDVNADWLSPKIDEDGRIMGNLARGRESVIDAAIDLLILGHSSIVGFSGSTFQSMARLLGDHYNLLEWNRPGHLQIYPPSEILRQLSASRINAAQLIQIAGTWSQDIRESTALHTMQAALEIFEGDEKLQILFALAQIAKNNNQPFLASIYLRELIRLAPTLADPRNMLSEVDTDLVNFNKKRRTASICFTGRELQISEVIQLVGKPNPLILEIGANCGQTTIEFLNNFPKAEIYAFEPDPRAAQKFRNLIDSSQVTLIEKAVSAHTGPIEFHQSGGHEWVDPKGWDHSGSIHKPKNHLKIWPSVTFDKTITVESIRLDDWSKDAIGNREIDFVWADVQGAEFDLIKGASSTLAHAKYFYTEFSDDEWYEGQINFDRLVQLMNNLGYKVLHKFPCDVLFVRVSS
jgi:FkbM family methyltransferase